LVPPLVWTLPSGVIACGGLFGDITIVEPGEVEHQAGLTADRRTERRVIFPVVGAS